MLKWQRFQNRFTFSPLLEFLLPAPSMLSAHTERKQPHVLFITKTIAAALQVHFYNTKQKLVSPGGFGCLFRWSWQQTSGMNHFHLLFYSNKQKHCVSHSAAGGAEMFTLSHGRVKSCGFKCRSGPSETIFYRETRKNTLKCYSLRIDWLSSSSRGRHGHCGRADSSLMPCFVWNKCGCVSSPGWFKAEGGGEASAAIPGDETWLQLCTSGEYLTWPGVSILYHVTTICTNKTDSLLFISLGLRRSYTSETGYFIYW